MINHSWLCFQASFCCSLSCAAASTNRTHRLASASCRSFCRALWSFCISSWLQNKALWRSSRATCCWAGEVPSEFWKESETHRHEKGRHWAAKKTNEIKTVAESGTSSGGRLLSWVTLTYMKLFKLTLVQHFSKLSHCVQFWPSITWYNSSVCKRGYQTCYMTKYKLHYLIISPIQIFM